MAEEKWRKLAEAMSDISEEYYCAGWMCGLEFDLWGMVAHPTASRRYGMGAVTEAEIAKLRALSEEVDGWVVWHDDADEPGLPPAQWGERFLSMAEWLKVWERAPAIYKPDPEGATK